MVNQSHTFYGWLFHFAGMKKLQSPAIAVDVFQMMISRIQ